MMRKIAMSFVAGSCLTLAWYSGYVMGSYNTPEPFSQTTIEAANPQTAMAAPTTRSEPAPLKVKEVVDLARAYEPVPTQEPVVGESLQPASFNDLPPREKMPHGQTFNETLEIAPREVK